MRLPRPTARLSRDTILFGAGMAGIAYETLSGRSDPTLVVAFIGMLGSPLIIRTDEKRAKEPPVPPSPAPAGEAAP